MCFEEKCKNVCEHIGDVNTPFLTFLFYFVPFFLSPSFKVHPSQAFRVEGDGTPQFDLTLSCGDVLWSVAKTYGEFKTFSVFCLQVAPAIEGLSEAVADFPEMAGRGGGALTGAALQDLASELELWLNSVMGAVGTATILEVETIDEFTEAFWCVP